MKKLTGILLFGLLLGIIGCREEITENDQASNQQESDIGFLYYNNGKNQQSKMLVFNNLEDFHNKVLELRRNSNKYMEDIVKQYSNLDEEELNDKLLEIKFDEYKPLIDFEKSIGFKSALSKYLEAENEWLKTEHLNNEKDPDIVFNGLEADEMVLLSPDLTVKIGDAIIVQKEDGKLRINDGSLETLESFLTHKSISEINLENYNNTEVQYFKQPIHDWTTCTSVGYKTKYWEHEVDNHTYSMKGKARHTSNDYWHGTQLYVKTKYYKLGWTGIWHGYSTNIRVSMEGEFDYWLPYPGVNHCGEGLYHVNHNDDYDYDSDSSTVNYEIYFSPYEVLSIELGKMEANHQASTLDENQSFN